VFFTQSRILLGFKIGGFWVYETKKRKRARKRLVQLSTDGSAQISGLTDVKTNGKSA
jgi:hypothetical protein